MKLKILNLFNIFLLLLSLSATFLETGCEKEEWNELHLTDNYCTDVANEEIGFLENHSGILISSGTLTPAFSIDADIYGDVLPKRKVLFPCNLPQEGFFYEGQKIIFSGSLLSRKGSGSDSIVGDAFSIPIILTNAKVRN